MAERPLSTAKEEWEASLGIRFTPRGNYHKDRSMCGFKVGGKSEQYLQFLPSALVSTGSITRLLAFPKFEGICRYLWAQKVW